MNQKPRSPAELMPSRHQMVKNDSGLKESQRMVRRWGHPLARHLGGVVFWITHVIVAICLIAILLLSCFPFRIDAGFALIVPAAAMIFGMAVIFAYGGWLVRNNR